MYLKSIKLSGFKSFVEPTTVAVRSHMNAVVGPNGCGKSNIVDAIRWVIGEGSAKKLRGQSMSDVIFNGTSNRKPVGRAMVELHFDNSAQRLVGEYAKYTDIVIRREVERDGQSSYYLNGAHCRRRDIVDIFLGTGLGARSYSIIEQGMISQLVEAKPEDMRAHIEEVAGISKYKERRRETENRMQHTQENLDRLNDLMQALDKQLKHLKRQANAAERYKEYKADTERLSAELTALNWRLLEEQRINDAAEIRTHQLGQEAARSTVRQLEAAITRLQAEQETQLIDLQDTQKAFYKWGEQIARQEQQLQSYQEQQQRYQKERSETSALWDALNTDKHAIEQKCNQLQQELAQLLPSANELAESVASKTARLTEKDQAYRTWQARWQHEQQEAVKIESQLRVFTTEQTHHQQQFDQCQMRLETMRAQQAALDITSAQQAIAPAREAYALACQQKNKHETDLRQMQEQYQALRTNAGQLKQALEEVESAWQSAEAEKTELAALQKAVLGGSDIEATRWLEHHALSDHRRLAQQLKVTVGWERAVETVMQSVFDAVCVDSLSDYMQALAQFEKGQITLIEPASSTTSTLSGQPCLLDQINSSWPCAAWASSVYTADSIEAAESIRHQLEPHESVITQAGLWMGPNWLRVAAVDHPKIGVIERERALVVAKEKVQALSHQRSQKKQALADNEAHLLELDHRRDALQTLLAESTMQSSQQEALLQQKTAHLARLEQDQERLNAEISELIRRDQAASRALSDLEQQSKALLHSQQEQLQSLERLGKEQSQYENALEQARADLQQVKLQQESLDFKKQTYQQQLNEQQQAAVRNAQQIEQLQLRRTEVDCWLEERGASDVDYQQQLQAYLLERSAVESRLQAISTAVGNRKSEISRLEQEKVQSVNELASHTERFNTLQLSAQAVLTRQETHIESLSAQGVQAESILQTLPEDADSATWQEHLLQLEHKIQRLGPINLAAIDEFNDESKRAAYLEQQHQDLSASLETLRGAIRKIDRETKARFKATFETVNEGFKETFPRIFGGGRAYLELSDEDLLTAGITVKAQPPGKRNSTIHMLSGGEKALTAISLVFALFKLNPAPFCILDEVDAPLDDLNVSRFCQLVRQMAQETQFLIISHNKVTIEMADHLMGVTMQEPGVSRLVAVDMQEALNLVDA